MNTSTAPMTTYVRLPIQNPIALNRSRGAITLSTGIALTIKTSVYREMTNSQKREIAQRPFAFKLFTCARAMRDA